MRRLLCPSTTQVVTAANLSLSGPLVSPPIVGAPERGIEFARSARANGLLRRVVRETVCQEPRALWQ